MYGQSWKVACQKYYNFKLSIRLHISIHGIWLYCEMPNGLDDSLIFREPENQCSIINTMGKILRLYGWWEINWYHFKAMSQPLSFDEEKSCLGKLLEQFLPTAKCNGGTIEFHSYKKRNSFSIQSVVALEVLMFYLNYNWRGTQTRDTWNLIPFSQSSSILTYNLNMRKRMLCS